MKNNIKKLEEEINKLNEKSFSFDEINTIINTNKNIADLLESIESEISENNIVKEDIDNLSNNEVVNKFLNIYLDNNNYINDNNEDSNRENMNTLQLYFNNFKDYKLLTSEEEIELARKYKQGDEEAREKLICSNLRLVVYFAKKYNSKSSLTLEDLIQEGNRGLIKAVETFDPDKNIKFSTHAAWKIKYYITYAMSFKSKIINYHSYDAKKQYKNIITAVEEYNEKYSTYPSIKYISEKTGYTTSTIFKTLSMDNILSLDAELTADSSSFTLLNTALSDENIEDDYVNNEEKKYIDNKIKNDLKDNSLDYAIIKLRYGFDFNEPLYVKTFGKNNDVILSTNYLNGSQINELASKKIADESKIYLNSQKINDVNLAIVDEEEHTLEEIGNIFNISAERVKQRQYRALNNIKKSLEEDGYKSNNKSKKLKK